MAKAPFFWLIANLAASATLLNTALMSSAIEPISATGWRALYSKPALSLCAFWFFLGVAYYLPSPIRYLLRGAVETIARTPSIPAVPTRPKTPTKTAQPVGAKRNKPKATKKAAVQAIEDPKQKALAHFAARLSATARKKGVTRITHYGDSLIDLDHITAPLRRTYQKRFGDAGHGFSLMAKPWPWYNQIDVGLARGQGWKTYRLVGGKRPDFRLGLGGSAAESEGGKRWLRIWTKPTIPFSQVEIAYLKRPKGGSFDIVVDKKTIKTVDTSAAKIGSGFARVELSDAAHRVRLKVRGRVRIFGATLERKQPGVVWDNLPLVSVRFHQLAKIDADNWREQLAHRGSDLVIFQFGANDSRNYGGDLKRYGEKIATVLGRLHRALPKASCLVIGPLDQLVKNSRGQLRSPKVIRRVAERQREVAIAGGCAFWDAQLAMGGPGSMKTWLDRRLTLKDMVHLHPKGGALIAERFDRALTAALSHYRAR